MVGSQSIAWAYWNIPSIGHRKDYEYYIFSRGTL